MIYATYEFYTTEYRGSALEEEEFNSLAVKASVFLDYYTRGKAANYPNLPELKMACCAIAEQQKVIDDANALAKKSMAFSLENDGQERQSETVGSHSKTFVSGGDSAAAALSFGVEAKKTLADIAMLYLSNTGLLYRGGRCR